MSEANLLRRARIQERYQIKLWSPAKMIYMALMAYNLLTHFWLLLTNTSMNMPAYIWIPRIVSASLAIYLGKLWRDRGFRILAVYTILFFFRAIIPNPNNAFTNDISDSVLSALWLFAGCYGLGHILNAKQLKRFLMICSDIWTIGIVILCCLAIYSVWFDKWIHVFENGIIGLYPKRLIIIYYSSTTAAILGISSLISIIRVICSSKRIVKILYVIALIPIIIALAITDSRSACISVSVGFGFIAFFFVARKICTNKKVLNRSGKIRQWSIGIAILIVVCIISMLLILSIPHVINQIRVYGFIPVAYADGANEGIVSNRGLTGLQELTGRTELWQEITEYIGDNPQMLLFGQSKLTPLSDINIHYGHCHNTYLQILVESGIPGLLLITFFIATIIPSVLNAIKRDDIPVWIVLLPAVLISLAIGDMADCFVWLRASHSPMITVFFILTGIIKSTIPAKTK